MAEGATLPTLERRNVTERAVEFVKNNVPLNPKILPFRNWRLDLSLSMKAIMKNHYSNLRLPRSYFLKSGMKMV